MTDTPEKIEPVAGLKRADIEPCCVCGEGILKDSMTFYRVSVQQFFAHHQNIRRAHGMEALMGSPTLAALMGPNEDLAVALSQPQAGLLCLRCSTERSFGSVLVSLQERDNDGERDGR